MRAAPNPGAVVRHRSAMPEVLPALTVSLELAGVLLIVSGWNSRCVPFAHVPLADPPSFTFHAFLPARPALGGSTADSVPENRLDHGRNAPPDVDGASVRVRPAI